jgi:hypothetical protein
MDEAMRLADMMARGKMAPAHFHNSPGDCLMVIEQAMRWNMSPFAVMLCTSVIRGRLMFEGKIVAAAVENSGAIDGYFDYKFSGTGADRRVTVTATRRGESVPKSVEVTLKDAITDNAWWKKTPDQMLVYHGARVWARRWTPAVMLGVYSPDEFNATDHVGETIDLQSAPVLQPKASQIDPPPARKPSVSAWLYDLSAALHAAHDEDSVQEVMARFNVDAACASLKNGALAKLNEMINDALYRTAGQKRVAPEPQAPSPSEGGAIDDDIPF